METYEDVYSAVFSEPYYGRSWNGLGRLPVYQQTLTSLLQGLLSRETPLGLLATAAHRTVRSGADLRWGKPAGQSGIGDGREVAGRHRCGL